MKDLVGYGKPMYGEPLFDPKTTLPPKCACGTTRKNLCQHDADIAYNRIGLDVRRPRTCLNRIGPTDLPEGY